MNFQSLGTFSGIQGLKGCEAVGKGNAGAAQVYQEADVKKLGLKSWRGSAGRVFALALMVTLAILSVGCSSVKEHLAMKEGAKLYKAQKYLDAAKQFEVALNFNPGRAENWKNLGYCYWCLIEPGSTQQKDIEYTDLALNAFRKYLDTNPEDSEKIQDYLINLYVNQTRLDDGIKFYEDLLQKSPNEPRILQTLALMYGKKGDFQKSLEYSTKKADLTPNDVAGYVFIGALTWQRSYNKADEPAVREEIVQKGMEALDKAIKLKADSFEALLYTNLLYRQKAELAKMAAEAERKDKKKAKALQEQAAEYMKMAEQFRDKAIAVRKAQTAKPETPAADAPKPPEVK